MHSVSKKMEGIAENTAVVHLVVPFRDKAVVKRCGGWWDSAEKRWCVEVEIALQMSGTELQKYWPPDFDSLLPYLLNVRRKKSGSLSFAEDFCFMLEQNPKSTRDAARVPENVHLRVSPAELQAFVHKRCDRPLWLDADVGLLAKKMAAAAEAIHSYFGCEHDADKIGLATLPTPYFWGVCVKAWVLRERPSGASIRVCFES